MTWAWRPFGCTDSINLVPELTAEGIVNLSQNPADSVDD